MKKISQEKIYNFLFFMIREFPIQTPSLIGSYKVVEFPHGLGITALSEALKIVMNRSSPRRSPPLMRKNMSTPRTKAILVRVLIDGSLLRFSRQNHNNPRGYDSKDMNPEMRERPPGFPIRGLPGALNCQVAVWGQAGCQHHRIDVAMLCPAFGFLVCPLKPKSLYCVV